jgi:hypothetical protein
MLQHTAGEFISSAAEQIFRFFDIRWFINVLKEALHRVRPWVCWLESANSSKVYFNTTQPTCFH